jgi:hypothetical protein
MIKCPATAMFSTCDDQDSIWVDVHEEWLSEVRPEG